MVSILGAAGLAIPPCGTIWPIGHQPNSVPLTLLSLSLRDYSIHRVPDCLSFRWNWVTPPPPSPLASVSPPPEPKGGEEQHSLADERRGTQFGRLERKPGTLYTM